MFRRGLGSALQRVGLALGAACVLPAAACGLAVDDGQRIADCAVQLAWRTEAGGIAVGQPFVLLMTVCPADAQLRRVDATMPAHRHGMNDQPSLQPLGGGRWRAEGLLWRMAGRWELLIEAHAAGQSHTLRQSVTRP